MTSTDTRAVLQKKLSLVINIKIEFPRENNKKIWTGNSVKKKDRWLINIWKMFNLNNQRSITLNNVLWVFAYNIGK